MINRRLALSAALLAPVALRAAEAVPADAKALAREELLHNDWPNLRRYRDANQEVATGSAQVVFMGDSITEGWSVKSPALFAAGRINRGISGQTTPQMLVRFRPDVIALRPRVVHIMAGTNDVAGNTGPSTVEMIQANIMSMVELAQAHSIAVILASVPPAASFPWKPEVEPVAAITSMNAWLVKYASDRKLVYADYYAALSDGAGGIRKGLADDGVHPTAAGYAVMNPIANAAIAKSLGPKPAGACKATDS